MNKKWFRLSGSARFQKYEAIMCELKMLHERHLSGQNGGDTRSYLSLDLPEQNALLDLLEAMTGVENYTVAPGPASKTSENTEAA